LVGHFPLWEFALFFYLVCNPFPLTN